MDGEFEPISARTDVPVTDREVFEYANGKLAYYLLEKKEVYSQIPKKTREIIALFPQALPMG
ncbi:hypothetical protein AKJ38_03480 [candidate division MSBL1 archaeon SCGC-AAA259I14]|uniref:Uncharacterized protein n=1 Tax=candidate division MSBL1 archaeon SCGC-AAA259I14 TaxID=1698268 RepID=A0A133UQB3_9EURY|nr:hypothetical protein AKJ38_03480 [candidate division MSBL1 archaeon SCGC-AAA259I14]